MLYIIWNGMRADCLFCVYITDEGMWLSAPPVIWGEAVVINKS